MKCTILHESRGRLRVHVCNVRMTLHRADVLEAYLNHHDAVSKAKVYERTGDVVVYYTGSRKDAVAALSTYRFDDPELDALVTSADSRRINQEYQEKMYNLVAGRVLRNLFLPAPLNAAYTVFRSIEFLWKGVCCLWRRKLEVEVLDALSIGVSILRGDFATAGSVMFLLNVGSLLEEWTRKKSLDDLARSMALNVDKVWVRAQGTEVLMPLTKVHPGDEIVVRSGNMIPLDGTVIEGELIPTLIDEIPIIAVLAATANGTTVIRNAEELKVKESNRLDIMVNELTAMGVSLEGTDDGMIIEGGKPFHGAQIDSRLDHRIAMSFAIASLAAETPTEILRAGCVDISYPTFYQDLARLQA